MRSKLAVSYLLHSWVISQIILILNIWDSYFIQIRKATLDTHKGESKGQKYDKSFISHIYTNHSTSHFLNYMAQTLVSPSSGWVNLETNWDFCWPHCSIGLHANHENGRYSTIQNNKKGKINGPFTDTVISCLQKISGLPETWSSPACKL